MGQTQGGVRVRTLRLGKATLLLAGALGTTGFAEICCFLESAARWDWRAGTRGAMRWARQRPQVGQYFWAGQLLQPTTLPVYWEPIPKY